MLHALLIAIAAWTAGGLLVTIVSARAIPRLEGAAPAAPGSPLPRLSIIVPARNEARAIRAAISSFLRQDYPNWEVIVVDDQSTDGTGEILDEIARREPRLRVIHNDRLPAGWLGKPHALHLGAAAATGDLLLFVDADVRYAPALLRQAVDRLLREGWEFLGLLPRVEMQGFWEHVLMPFVPGAFYAGLGLAANAEWIRHVAAGGGPGNLITRRAYDAIGGHAALANSVIDDVRLAVHAKQAGFRGRIVRAEPFVSLRMYHGFREVFDGFTKNASHLYYGWAGTVLFLMLACFITAQLVPVALLLAAAAGIPLAHADVLLAAGSVLLALASRLLLQRLLFAPLWPALAYPLQAAVWTGITLRSFYSRLVRNEVLWRGRRYDAGQARF